MICSLCCQHRDIGILHVVCDGRERIARHFGDDYETDGGHV